MKIEGYTIGQAVLFIPVYEPGVNYEGTITNVLDDQRAYDYLIHITKRITNARPNLFRHQLRENVPALGEELQPILRTPADIEAYLAT